MFDFGGFVILLGAKCQHFLPFLLPGTLNREQNKQEKSERVSSIAHAREREDRMSNKERHSEERKTKKKDKKKREKKIKKQLWKKKSPNSKRNDIFAFFARHINSHGKILYLAGFFSFFHFFI